MGKIIKKRIEYGGSSNSAENIKYDDTKNVKEAINEVDNLLGNTDISAIGDGTVTGGLDALNGKLMNIYGIKKLRVIPISVVGTIPTSSKQNVIIDISTYGFISAPNVWVKDSTMCTISIINVTNKSISVDVYNAWGGSIVANNSVLGHLMAMELTA